VQTFFKDGKDYIKLSNEEATPLSFWRISPNVIRVDSGPIIYELEYFADHQNIHIIDFETGYVKSAKRFEKDQGDESTSAAAQDQIRSSMPGAI